MDLTHRSALDLLGLLGNKEIKPREVVDAFLSNIERDSGLNAFVTLLDGQARQRADSLEGKAALPIAIKDNINIKSVRTTCGSRILENFISPYDAAVIERLTRKDAVFLGKTNMDEFAMGSSTETSTFGPTLNPADRTRIPGGSSGGSAAAVAAFLAPWALGSDTGGSIRQPASLCGIVGLKPTYGLVSRYGLVAFASSLDQIGPLTRTVKDSALLLNWIAGHDSRDSTSSPDRGEDYLEGIDAGVKGLKIGLPKEYFIEGIDPAVRSAVDKAAKSLEKAGAVLVEVSLPHTKYAVEVYYIIAPAEASSNLSRYDGVKYGFRADEAGTDADLLSLYTTTRSQGFGPEVKRRILIGTYVLSAGFYDAYYLKAQKVRTLIRKDFEEAFKTADVLLTPTAPSTAFKLKEKMDDPLKMYLSDIFTISANLAGIPGLSVPAAVGQGALPVGVQFLAPSFGEKLLLRTGRGYEILRDG